MSPSNRRLPPRSKRCSCLQACNYHMLRCDSCHRGVHVDCLKLLAKPSVFVCTSCKNNNNGVEEARVAEIRAAEGKPCAVMFHGTCHYHVGEVARGRKIRPELLDEHADEELSGSLCDICNSTCQFFDILCDKCDVDWHAHCVGMTRELAERIDKWYSQRCLDKDAQLRVTYNDGQEAEQFAIVTAAPPPGPPRVLLKSKKPTSSSRQNKPKAKVPVPC
ncbi:hypothetical protein AAVH_19041 [Aphelenchoides avenae]|nr:hypothetical protein AAVH_19041 [Aphelenchus avenae]